MAATGWPTAADLSAHLGLDVADDAVNVAGCNDAAIADCIYYVGLDPVAGTSDAGQFRGVLLMGSWWYENRNRPEGLDSLNAMATPYYRKVAWGIVGRGLMVIA
jgi:hypothetical protein